MDLSHLQEDEFDAQMGLVMLKQHGVGVQPVHKTVQPDVPQPEVVAAGCRGQSMVELTDLQQVLERQLQMQAALDRLQATDVQCIIGGQLPLQAALDRLQATLDNRDQETVEDLKLYKTLLQGVLPSALQGVEACRLSTELKDAQIELQKVKEEVQEAKRQRDLIQGDLNQVEKEVERLSTAPGSRWTMKPLALECYKRLTRCSEIMVDPAWPKGEGTVAMGKVLHQAMTALFNDPPELPHKYLEEFVEAALDVCKWKQQKLTFKAFHYLLPEVPPLKKTVELSHPSKLDTFPPAVGFRPLPAGAYTLCYFDKYAVAQLHNRTPSDPVLYATAQIAAYFDRNWHKFFAERPPAPRAPEPPQAPNPPKTSKYKPPSGGYRRN